MYQIFMRAIGFDYSEGWILNDTDVFKPKLSKQSNFNLKERFFITLCFCHLGCSCANLYEDLGLQNFLKPKQRKHESETVSRIIQKMMDNTLQRIKTVFIDFIQIAYNQEKRLNFISKDSVACLLIPSLQYATAAVDAIDQKTTRKFFQKTTQTRKMKRNEKGEMIVFQTESSSRKTLDKGFYTHKHNSAGFKSQHIVDIHDYTIHVVSGIECSKSDKALYDFNYQASLTTNGNVILGDTGYLGCRDVLTTLPKKSQTR